MNMGKKQLEILEMENIYTVSEIQKKKPYKR